jgi:hypothetical protein
MIFMFSQFIGPLKKKLFTLCASGIWFFAGRSYTHNKLILKKRFRFLLAVVQIDGILKE